MRRRSLKSKLALVLAVLTVSVLFIVGCTGGEVEYNGSANTDSGDPAQLFKSPSDPEVLAVWDSYELLKKLPRYTASGYFSEVVENEEGSVYMYFYATEADDFETYCGQFRNAGFRLKEDSGVWASEDVMGAPVYVGNGLEVKVVWLSTDGMLTVCSSPAQSSD